MVYFEFNPFIYYFTNNKSFSIIRFVIDIFFNMHINTYKCMCRYDLAIIYYDIGNNKSQTNDIKANYKIHLDSRLI